MDGSCGMAGANPTTQVLPVWHVPLPRMSEAPSTSRTAARGTALLAGPQGRRSSEQYIVNVLPISRHPILHQPLNTEYSQRPHFAVQISTLPSSVYIPKKLDSLRSTRVCLSPRKTPYYSRLSTSNTTPLLQSQCRCSPCHRISLSTPSRRPPRPRGSTLAMAPAVPSAAPPTLMRTGPRSRTWLSAGESRTGLPSATTVCCLLVPFRLACVREHRY
jgi:hypothetical protein